MVICANGLGPIPTGGACSPIANVPSPIRSYRGGAAFEDSEGGLVAWEGGEAAVLIIFGASYPPFSTSKTLSTTNSVSVALPDAAHRGRIRVLTRSQIRPQWCKLLKYNGLHEIVRTSLLIVLHVRVRAEQILAAVLAPQHRAPRVMLLVVPSQHVREV